MVNIQVFVMCLKVVVKIVMVNAVTSLGRNMSYLYTYNIYIYLLDTVLIGYITVKGIALPNKYFS